MLRFNKDTYIYFAIFFTAFFVRAIFVLVFPPEKLFQDEPHYDKLGVEISNSIFCTSYKPFEPKAELYPYVHQTITRPPLYPIWLAIIYSIFGHALLVARLGNALLGAITAVLTALLARHIGGRLAGFIAGIFTVFYPISVYLSRTLFVENLALPLFASFVLTGLLAVRSKKYIWAVIAGLVGGLCALSRANLYALIPLFSLCLGGVIWREGYKKKAVVTVVILLIVAALTILPRFLNNGLRYGLWTPIATTTWFNTCLGFNEYVDAFEHRVVEDFPKLQDEAARYKGDDSQVEAYFKEKTFEYIRKNPGWSAYLYFGRLISFFDFRTKIRNPNFIGYSFLKDMVNLFSYGLVLSLSIVGLFVREVRKRGLLLYFVLGIMPFTLAFFNISIRYRIPVEPLLIALASTTFVIVLNWLKERFKKVKTNC
jgi:4-amino-4-deoxy-L-arabinose transferase-like glycosyltransferase